MMKSTWGAHEALESVWKNVHHEERDLLNAIILIADAFVHDQKDGYSICIHREECHTEQSEHKLSDCTSK